MSVPTRTQVNWAKNAALRILEDIEQNLIKQDVFSAERWDPDTVYPEKRYSVKIGDADALCNTLYHLHTIYGPLRVVVEGRETNGDVCIGCYLEPNNKSEAIIRMQAKGEGISSTANEICSRNSLPNEALEDESAISEIPKKEPKPTPVASWFKSQSLNQIPIERIEASVPLVAKIDCDLPEKDHESVDLSGNSELDEEWVDVEYPAGSNGWWRVRQRAKGHREGRTGEYLPVEG